MIRSLKFYFIVAKGKCIKEQMVPARTKGKNPRECKEWSALIGWVFRATVTYFCVLQWNCFNINCQTVDFILPLKAL